MTVQKNNKALHRLGGKPRACRLVAGLGMAGRWHVSTHGPSRPECSLLDSGGVVLCVCDLFVCQAAPRGRGGRQEPGRADG